jgi:hypothetical protein
VARAVDFHRSVPFPRSGSVIAYSTDKAADALSAVLVP